MKLNDYVLTADECDDIGVDSTLRVSMTGEPQTYATLSDEAKVRFWQRRIVRTPQFAEHRDGAMLVEDLRAVANALGKLEHTWVYILDLPGDFIVPELGLPVSLSLDDAGAELWHLAELIDAANDEAMAYRGKHRGRPAA